MARPTKRAALADLTACLGAAPPPGVARRPAADLVALRTLVEAAETRQAEAVAAGSEEALRHVPRLLRGPLARALRG